MLQKQSVALMTFTTWRTATEPCRMRHIHFGRTKHDVTERLGVKFTARHWWHLLMSASHVVKMVRRTKWIHFSVISPRDRRPLPGFLGAVGAVRLTLGGVGGVGLRVIDGGGGGGSGGGGGGWRAGVLDTAAAAAAATVTLWLVGWSDAVTAGRAVWTWVERSRWCCGQERTNNNTKTLWRLETIQTET